MTTMGKLSGNQHKFRDGKVKSEMVLKNILLGFKVLKSMRVETLFTICFLLVEFPFRNLVAYLPVLLSLTKI